MATVIDALVVTLGLDPRNFTKGQKEAAAAFLKTRDEARRTATDIEKAGASAAQFYSKLRNEALGFFAALLGGRQIKQFVVDMTQMQAETGRTAQILGTTTQMLAAWRGAAILAGGSAAGVSASLGGLVNQFQQFALTGESSVIPYFRALGVDIADVDTGKMRSINDILFDLARAGEKMDPAKAAALFRAIGFDEGTISLLLKGEAAVRRLIDAQKDLGTVTKEDAEASAQLVQAWGEAEQSATSFFRTIVTRLTPALTTMLGRVRDVFAEFQKGQYITPGSFLDRLINGSKNVKKNADGSTPSLLRSMASPGGPLDKLLKDWEAKVDATDRLNSHAEPSAVWTGPVTDRRDFRAKPGAGRPSLAMAALAQSIQADIPELNRFTAFNDVYHQLLGRGSAHKTGQALDFTIKDPAQSAAVSEKINQLLKAGGFDAMVLDHYKNEIRRTDTAGVKPYTGGQSTAPHIHVQFNSAAAAARYADVAAGAKGSAAIGDAGGGRSTTITNTTNIGKVDVVTQATDAAGVAKDFKPAMERNSLATQANTGAN